MNQPEALLAELWSFCRGKEKSLLVQLLEGHPEITGLLNTKDETTELHDTALTACCRNGWVEGVELLIARGAGVDEACKDLRTPLFVAAAEGHEKVV